MKIMAILIAVVALVSGANALDNASNSTAATMAVADPSRPDSDTTRDADRKPAQTLVFVGVKSGDKVADYVADAGYFTRLFASVVGSTGHVYAGVYVILDHSAALGAPANVTESLHRIESSTVRREVEAAGFKFDSESSILANPADPRTAKVFDQTIRGHTDQFFLKFRKPE